MIKQHSRHTLLLAVCALLFVVAGCSQGQGSSQPVHTTPITLPPATSTPSKASANKTPTISTSSSDWTTYHQNNARTGAVANAPDPHQLTQAWNVQLDGSVYAEPLVVKGRVVVVTEGDSFYSLDMHTGGTIWHTKVGTPVPQSTLPCGDIDPLGITGTPVYDPATNLVFAVAEVTGPGHILVGVDADSGQVRVRRLIDIPSMDPVVHQQRAALALSQNMVYVAFGGLDGDCGDYIGTVVASRTDGTGSLLSYRVPTPREGGIWAASGPAVDASGNIYVSVGNGAITQGNWDHSDSILRLSPSLQLEDGFAPDQWPQDNASDADLGSMGPLLLPGGLIFADGKSGFGYLLNANHLGGVGGQAFVTSVCHSYGGSAVLGSQIFVPCADSLREVTLGPGATLHLGWQAAYSVTGSPIVGGHTVYSLKSGGTLYAFDSSNGNVRATISVGETSRFATPTLSGNQVFVGTLNGIAAVTIS